jgi:uncharacterized protein
MKTITKISWHSPKIEVRDTGRYGCGSFAIAPIPKGELVSVQGGHIITLAELLTLAPPLQDYSYQISDELVIAATSLEEVTAGECLNHSCDPNLGFQSELRLVAMRDISIGEEVTFDYATCMTANYGDMECGCGAANCRGRFMGEDWKLPELQQRLRGYFQPYIAEKISQINKEEQF